MVVHHPGRLHERVTDGGADEPKAALLQIPAHRIRFGGGGRNLLHRAPAVLPGRSADEPPDVAVKAAELTLNGQERAGIRDRRIDLEPVAHDARILHQPGALFPAEARDFVWIEAGKRLAVVFAFLEYRVPRQSRLRAFEDQEFEPQTVVMDRNAPLRVVVKDFAIIDVGPRAASSHFSPHHRFSR